MTFLVVTVAAVCSSYLAIKKIDMDDEVRVNTLYESIDKKFDFLNLTIYDFKTGKVFREYFFEDKPLENKQYKKIKLFDELKKINTIYGNIGCSISMGEEGEDLLFTPEGTVNRKEYLQKLKFPVDTQKIKKYIAEDGETINIFFKDENNYDRDKIFWIISLNKNDFFSEIKLELENWYITNQNEAINLKNKNRDTTIEKIEQNRRATKFLLPYFYENIFYIQPKINIPALFLYEFFKMVLVAGIVYLLFYAVKYFVVRPIKQLAGKMGYINNSNEKELEYIAHKIDEINTLNKDLQYKISDMRTYQKKKRIKDFLIGLTEQRGLTLIEDSEIVKMKGYRVIIMEIYDIDSVDNIFNKFNLSKELMLKYFSEEILCEEVDIDYKSIAFILEDSLTKEDLQEIFKCIVVHIERKFSLRFTAVVTNVYEEIEQLPKAYRAAKRLLDYKFVFKEKRVIFQDLIAEKEMNKYYYPIELEAKLILRTLSSNELSVRRALDEIFDDKSSRNMDKKYVKEFGGLLYNTLSRIFIQLKDINSEIDIKAFNAEELLNENDVNDLRKKFEKKILDICKFTKTKDLSDTVSIKLKIERYLEENYMIDISLDNLADHLGHSFKYTSVLFKKVMGDNFKNYINVYRIEKAKELMSCNKELKMKDLAELLGYNSSNTFIRIFRKYEGVSPGKYFGIGEQDE